LARTLSREGLSYAVIAAAIGISLNTATRYYSDEMAQGRDLLLAENLKRTLDEITQNADLRRRSARQLLRVGLPGAVARPFQDIENA
jgi:hypothetical protein